MARAIVARRHGDDFQARLFWLKALCLLDPNSPVVKVAYETGPRGFDDILVEYDSNAAPQDHEGKPIYRRHIQCKWHTIDKPFGYKDLIDPDFIHAECHSLLQKAHQAQIEYAPEGLGCQFELVTTSRIKQDDPLLKLIRKESNALDLASLFDNTTDRSRMGKVRKCWREHLGIDHTGLRLLVRTLSVVERSQSLADLREQLNDRLAAAGLKPVHGSKSGFPYDDLVSKLFAQGNQRVEFDRSSFLEMAQREGILEDKAKVIHVPSVGVRSFMHPIDNLGDRCKPLLNLVPYFDGRYIKSEADWQAQIFPELQKFVIKAAQSGDRLRIILDTHVSIAFAVGALLNVKSGKQIEIEQRTGGRHLWAMDDVSPDSNWPQFLFEEEVITQGDEIALVIGLTHDIGTAAHAHVKAALPRTGSIIHCRLVSGASQQAVHSGRHAWMLAEAAVQQLRACRPNRSHTHLFIAGPNGFVFFLGQYQQAIGPTTTYEWDYDGLRSRGYRPGLSLSNMTA